MEKINVHQIWLGNPMPERLAAMCATVRCAACAAGMHYKLWTEKDLDEFSDLPGSRIVARVCRDCPSPTSYGLASDWYRIVVLSRYGGWYLDTDCKVRDDSALRWMSPWDLTFSWEGRDLPCPGVIRTADGDRGKRAAEAMLDATQSRLGELLPLNSTIFAQKVIEIEREDTHRSGIAAKGIGPVALRTVTLPKVSARGFSVGIFPPTIYADIRKKLQPKILHYGVGTWHAPHVDWSARFDAAMRTDASHADKPKIRPQSTRVLPNIGKKRTICVPVVKRELADGLVLPTGTKRMIIFSNVPGVDTASIGLGEGDHCIHINRARHFDEVRSRPGVTHALVIRSHSDRSHGRCWFDPSSTDGAMQVIHVMDGPMASRRPWWQQYRHENPGKCPTTGFIAWHLATEANPRIPVVLAGFAPGEPFGSPLYKGHAWDYERNIYKRAGVCILRPLPPSGEDRRT